LVAEYYDRQGFPIPAVDGVEPALVWARMFEDPNYRRVALDELPDGSLLSTAWLGLYYGFGGQPYIFETMRFKEERGGRRDRPPFPERVEGGGAEQLRYTREEEALAAHHEIVRRLRIRLGHGWRGRRSRGSSGKRSRAARPASARRIRPPSSSGSQAITRRPTSSSAAGASPSSHSASPSAGSAAGWRKFALDDTPVRAYRH